MTNLEFVSMIDKMFEPKSDKKWKLYTILGCGALLAIALRSWSVGQKKGRDLVDCRSEVDRVKLIAQNTLISNEQLTNRVAVQEQYIQEQKKENQDMARAFAACKERIRKENESKS